MTAIPFKYLPDLVLFKIYEVAQSAPADNGFLISEIRAMNRDLAGAPFITKATHDLLNRSFLGYLGDDPEEQYELTVAGIKHVETALEDPSSVVSRFKANGVNFLDNDSPPPSAAPSAQGSSFTEFRDALLIALAEKNKVYDLTLLATEIGVPFEKEWDRKAAFDLRDRGLITEAFTFGGLHAEINGRGLVEAERLKKVRKVTSESIPASDRYVELRDNDPAYKEAINALSEAESAIRQSNAPVGYDREQIATELSIGARLLQNTKVRVGAAIALILTPLYTVYNDVAADTLRPVVEQAISALRNLLGI